MKENKFRYVHTYLSCFIKFINKCLHFCFIHRTKYSLKCCIINNIDLLFFSLLLLLLLIRCFVLIKIQLSSKKTNKSFIPSVSCRFVIIVFCVTSSTISLIDQYENKNKKRSLFIFLNKYHEKELFY